MSTPTFRRMTASRRRRRRRTTSSTCTRAPASWLSSTTGTNTTTATFQLLGRRTGRSKRTLAAFFDQHYHGYLATVVCALGIVANALNIVVLTRRNMISATNCILTGLAVSDGLTMAAYLPFALRFYVLYGTEPTPTRNSGPD